MKRWITFFLSLAVCVSAFSLGVHAENDQQNFSVWVNGSVGSSASNLNYNFSNYISDSVIGPLGGAYNYGQINYIIVEVPASSYFFISFDISAVDIYGVNTSVPYTYLDDGPGNNLSNISFGALDIFMYTVKPINFKNNDGHGIHVELYGRNHYDDMTYQKIEFLTPIKFHTDSYTYNGSTRYYNNQFENVQVNSFIDLNSLQSFLDNYFAYWQDEYWPTINTFYDEFHAKWSLLVDTYIYNLYDQYWKSAFPFYNGITENQDGTVSLNSKSSRRFGFGVANSLSTIIDLMFHQDKLINSAMEQGANEAYDDLNESASFGNLSDFASAGSSASWSAGSFVDGLGQTWNWFTQENKQMIDSVEPSRNEVYISIYDDTLEEYYRLLGGE